MSRAPDGSGHALSASGERTRALAAALSDRLPTSLVARPVRTVAFWAAIVLPVVLLVLLARGLSTTVETLAFAGLLGAELCVLVVGHSHRQETPSGE